MLNLNSLQYYPYIGPPSSWGGNDTPSTNEECKQTTSFSIGNTTFGSTGRVMNNSTYQYYAGRFFTVVDLTGNGFNADSVYLHIGKDGGTYNTTDNLYARFSYDSTTWTSWIKINWTKTTTTEEQLINLTANGVGYYFMQLRGKIHFYRNTSPNTGMQYRKTMKFTTDCALEGNLYTLYDNSETAPTTSSQIPHVRSMFACAFYSGDHLIYTHNLVANVLSQQNNFYYMFAYQHYLITAPMYWNCSVTTTTYAGSGGAYNFMFQNCERLRIGLRNYQIFNGSNGNGTGYNMYGGCTSLRLMFNWFNVPNMTRLVGGNIPNTVTETVTMWNGTQIDKRRIVLGLAGCNSINVGYMVCPEFTNWIKLQYGEQNALRRWGYNPANVTTDDAGVLPGNILNANTEWCTVST